MKSSYSSKSRELAIFLMKERCLILSLTKEYCWDLMKLVSSCGLEMAVFLGE